MTGGLQRKPGFSGPGRNRPIISNANINRDQNVRVRASAQWQARYTRFILDETNRLDGKFVVWFFFHDYDTFLGHFEGERAKKVQFLRWWRDNGMVDANGNPREALGIWDQWRNLPTRQ